MVKKSILKKLFIFGVPIVSLATIGSIIAIVKNKNVVQSDVNLDKKEVEITKSENNWFIYLKTEDKKSDNKNVFINNQSFIATLINKENGNFWRVEIPEKTALEKGKYKITLSENMTTKVNISEFELNWPLFEIVPSERKSEIVINFNELFSPKQISYKLEKENDSSINLTKSAEITNNKIVISIPSEWKKSKYAITSIYLDSKTKLFSNIFFNTNKQLLTLSNYELGELKSDKIIINSDTLEFDQDKTTEKKLYLINNINEISVIKGIYDSNNIIFDIKSLNKDYKWNPFRLISKNNQNGFEKTLAENKDFNKSIQDIYKKEEKEIKVKKVEFLDSNNILFFVEDANDWISDNINFKLNDQSTLNWTFLNEKLKIIKIENDKPFSFGDKITLKSDNIKIVNPDFNISKNINKSQNSLTSSIENDKLTFNFTNVLNSNENSEVNFKILLISKEGQITEIEKLFTNFNEKKSFEIELNSLINNETAFIVPGLVELRHGGNNEIFNFTKSSLNLFNLTEKQETKLSIFQKEEIEKSTLLRIKLPEKYKRMNNYLFTLEYKNNIIYGFSELDDLVFFAENININDLENIKITNLKNNEQFSINKTN
ncbi:hypothetical protein [Mesomycoplasma molare]|uniref:Lipoprotein n=1 Tax=Mesomycoplasma molare TaxID=171288 RepID=A0ABY5TTI8_9BACT|nr:hypothetical protein [Mesomycoplasma molare]UWD33978.1 hypothetical protein NX772_02620 [Mesomycoplasma molare]